MQKFPKQDWQVASSGKICYDSYKRGEQYDNGVWCGGGDIRVAPDWLFVPGKE